MIYLTLHYGMVCYQNIKTNNNNLHLLEDKNGLHYLKKKIQVYSWKTCSVLKF